MLEAKGITKGYPGVQALAGVDFKVDAGEVHGLLGENGAGKSTLIKIIAGSVAPDKGSLRMSGEPVPFGSPERSRQAGVGIVYQELSLVPTLSLAENVMLGRWPTGRWGTVSLKETRRLGREHLRRIGLDEDPEQRLDRLDMAERQLVEIAKALAIDARVLLLDEPTSALSEPEAERLFEIIRDLTASGVAVVYVSHRLGEMLEIADRVTVLRDGALVATRPIEEVTEADLARMMVGREVDVTPTRREPGSDRDERVLLRARGLGRPADLKPIDLELRAGEVLGVFGLVGSGRTRLARTMFGLEPATQGQVEIQGSEVRIASPAEAISLGIGYLAAERTAGIVPRLPVPPNITLASLDRLGGGPAIDFAEERALAEHFVEELDIRVASLDQPTENLSGGNQQKTILARWLLSNSKIMILDDPTRGVDVGAKEEVFRLVKRLASEGSGILYLTSEIKEARSLADRILIMVAGRVVAEVRPETSEEEIMAIAGGTRGR